MGTILSSKMKGEGKVVFEVLMDYEEALQLQGNMNNVHIFSENIAFERTAVSSRGKSSITKYFLIPRTLRKDLNLEKEINCQRIELKDKTIFIYVVEKQG